MGLSCAKGTLCARFVLASNFANILKYINKMIKKGILSPVRLPIPPRQHESQTAVDTATLQQQRQLLMHIASPSTTFTWG
jgi:hypothetical protein